MFRETEKRDQLEGFYNSPRRKLLKGSELILKGIGRKNIYGNTYGKNIYIEMIKLAGLRERTGPDRKQENVSRITTNLYPLQLDRKYYSFSFLEEEVG